MLNVKILLQKQKKVLCCVKYSLRLTSNFRNWGSLQRKGTLKEQQPSWSLLYLQSLLLFCFAEFHNKILTCSVHYALCSSLILSESVSKCVHVHACISVLLRGTLFLASPRSSAAVPTLTISGAPVFLASPVVPVSLIKGPALQRTTQCTETTETTPPYIQNLGKVHNY